MRGLLLRTLGIAVLALAVSAYVGPAASAQAPSPSPASSQADAVQLVMGCNNIALTWDVGTPLATVSGSIAPAGALDSIFRIDAVSGRFVGYSPIAPASVNDYTVVTTRFEAVYICMRAPGVLSRPIIRAPAVSPASAPAPAPSSSNPAAGLVGQTTARLCSFGQPFTGTVERADWTKTVAGISSSGMFVVVVVNAANTGVMPDSVSSAAQLRDERGRMFTADTSTVPTIPYLDLVKQYGVKGRYETIQPGLSARILLIFEVPSDVQRLELISRRPSCT